MAADHPGAEVDGPLAVLCRTGEARSAGSWEMRPALLSVPISDGRGPATPGDERTKAVWARAGGVGGLVIGSEKGVPRELTEPPQGRKEYEADNQE